MADDTTNREQPSTDPNDGDEQAALEAKLNAFDAKVKAAGSKRMPDVPDWNYQRQNKAIGHDSSGSVGAGGIGFALSLLYTLLGPIAGGYLIGLAINHYRHTQGSEAVGGAIGSVLGFAAMVFIATRQMNRDSKK